ncbi:MAG: HNH endonuclease [Rhizobium sp.]|nr:HNH endonuclease [Rhizobium sp.]MCZ8352902.1 HNH endonuclease [Rhizobium sp.]
MTELNNPGHEVEEWRPVPTLQHIEASSLGRIRYVGPKRRRIDTGHILAQRTNKHGYKMANVPVFEEGGRVAYKTRQIHRLVTLAFHGLAPEWAELVEHRDDCKTNNVPDNLFWSTHKANLNRPGFIAKQRAAKRGANHPFYGKPRSPETRARISAAKREAAARRRLEKLATTEAGSARHA